MPENVKPIAIEINKAFPVQVENLFDAWNNPEKLKEWWHPFDKNLSNVKNELKEGGVVDYTFEGEPKCHVSGEYKQVVASERLVYTWNWDLEHDEMKNGEYTLTIDFIPEENGSRLQIKQEGFVDENATEPHKKGWDRGLESLKLYLEGSSGTRTNTAQEAAPDMNDGSNEGEPTKGETTNRETKAANSAAEVNETKAGAQGTNATKSAEVTEPKAEEPIGRGVGEPEIKQDHASVGKGPIPVGPNQQTWHNPEASEEVKKKIDEQMARIDKFHENPNEQDPALAGLNQQHDIEGRGAQPDHGNKIDNQTQEDFDPRKNKSEAPEH